MNYYFENAYTPYGQADIHFRLDPRSYWKIRCVDSRKDSIKHVQSELRDLNNEILNIHFHNVCFRILSQYLFNNYWQIFVQILCRKGRKVDVTSRIAERPTSASSDKWMSGCVLYNCTVASQRGRALACLITSRHAAHPQCLPSGCSPSSIIH